ncbi:MAG: tagatose 1,6-diphosphate aldolase [Dehalococcoidia bacterium]|nr:MAG: tagatose 1,6-diphosphate aldolase [Dehalococcoidia bacterium]
MKKMTIGKYRGMQRLSDERGSICMCALDHRGSLEKMLKEGTRSAPSYQDMVDFKYDVCGALSPHCSAILLDPVYGAGQAIAADVLAGGTGLLVSLEETGYAGDAEGRVSRALEGWNAAKIRRMGADGAKLLLYYRPGGAVAAQQRALVEELAAWCEEQDLAFIVEPVGYAIGDEAKSGRYSKLKPEVVIQTAAEITPLGIDVLKAEFPADPKTEKDDGVMLENCKRLNEASQVPWIILSGGVDFQLFVRQVEIACKAGASGFLAGRALWQEATSIASREERQDFLETTVVDRLYLLMAVANAYGTPWYEKVSAPMIEEGWYKSY